MQAAEKKGRYLPAETARTVTEVNGSKMLCNLQLCGLLLLAC